MHSCSQLEVSPDSRGRVLKDFCTGVFLIHSAGGAYRHIIRILPTGCLVLRRSSNMLGSKKQVISLKIDYFLTAACGPFCLNKNNMLNEQRTGVWECVKIGSSHTHQRYSIAKTCGLSCYQRPIEHVSHTYQSKRGSGERPKGKQPPLHSTPNPLGHRMQKFRV